jgi:Rod binding domain-containing protein
MEIASKLIQSAAQRPEPGRTSAAEPADASGVAREFEALLLAQVLKSMRAAGQDAGWLGTDGDSSLSALSEMGEQLLAQSWSRSGGIGLASLLERAFQRSTGPTVVPATESPANPVAAHPNRP